MNSIIRPPLWLLTLLIMFPQLVETIYSPALPDIARSFQVSSERAAQTLSVYFFSFAAGVALWGWLSDWFGRRPAIMAGREHKKYWGSVSYAAIAGPFPSL